MRKKIRMRVGIVGPEGIQMVEGYLEGPPEDERPGWRPDGGPDSETGLWEAPKSLPIWVWGLLRKDPRTSDELREELGVSKTHLNTLLHRLRKHGYNIVRRGGRFHLLDDSPIFVEMTLSGLRVAPPGRGVPIDSLEGEWPGEGAAMADEGLETPANED